MARRSTLGGNLIPMESWEFVDPNSKDPMVYLDSQQQNCRFLQKGSMAQPRMQDGGAFKVQDVQGRDRDRFGLFVDIPSNGEMNSSLVSDEDELNFGEEGVDGDGKRESFWPRVKWTDTMVKLLVTALSYISEDYNDGFGGGFGGGKRKTLLVQKKGKWRSISKVMDERGFHVSPRQCEDKFNDLNKRYKKLNEALGRGTTCMVVENPSLLDTMNLSEKEKEEVKKIISSKHLFYEEMCSFYNGNQLFLPHDPDLQRSLHLAFRSKDDSSDKNQEIVEEEEQDVETNAQDGRIGENSKFQEISAKRFKRMDPYEDACLGKHFNFSDCNRRLDTRNGSTNVLLEDNSLERSKADELRKQWLKYRSLQLKEQNLHITGQMLELEKQRFKWQTTNWEQDKELEKMKLENERMRLENERMALEIESKKLCVN